MTEKRALILGIGGQDGYFMSRLLTEKGYRVIGILRPEDMAAETIPHLSRENLSSHTGKHLRQGSDQANHAERVS